MKKCNTILGGALLALVAATIAVAGNVYDRDTATLATATGAGTWQNTTRYSAVELKRVWVEKCLTTAQTVTVSRVTSGGAYTQACASVAFTSGSKGNSATFTAAYLKYGDYLTFSRGTATGATVVIDYEVQQH